ncbi:MAG: SCP2 sterol-binding domain-containing protein [Candidatus Saliniplasma sp.]
MSDDLEPKELLKKMVEKFEKTVEEKDGIEDKLEGFDRNISITFKDDGNFHFSIDETDISDIKEGSDDDADITIKTDTETLNALLNKDMKPMEAYARKKIKVDASFMDMLKIKNIF